MKLNKIKIFAVAGILILSAGACKKSFFTDVNRNPNAVDFVNPNLLLPSCEIALAFTQGGDLSRYSSLFTQQAFGEQNQTQAFYTYGINAGTFENGWSDMFTSTMENIFALKSSCDSNGFYNAYAGVARILMAYSLQLVVDNWGSVPYTEAFRGKLDPSHLQPKYDSAAALYDTIAKLVDNAIVLFGNTGNDLSKPSDDDVLYGGDLDKWTKFGHAIKARLYIHQSKNSPAMATNALAEIALSYTSNDESAIYVFAGGGTTRNPWTQFMSDRAGYITFGDDDYLIQQVKARNDPRLYQISDTLSDEGLGAYYGSDASPVEFITYDEMLFTEAEATLRTGGTIVTAQGFYQDAIRSSMEKLKIKTADINTYIAAHGTLTGTAADAIKQVAYEEYIALFLNPEAFTLYRRTGVPAITPPTGASGNVPRRMIYPQSEYSYNAANTPKSTLYTPVIFWDK
jgi:hypothetical protein